MHDPLAVAFTIRRPWPRRATMGPGGSWKWWWPPLVTVWHREPGGHDSGEVCKPYRRVFDEADRAWKLKPRNGWRLHFWHWRIQVHPAQQLRHWLLTRCAWCGGRHRKRDPVNISHSWDGPRGRWWQGEPGVFHDDCSAVQHAHNTCLCADPRPVYGDHGTCQRCGKFHAWRYEPDEADRLLAALPWGSRITPDRRPAIEAAWELRRARKEEAR